MRKNVTEILLQVRDGSDDAYNKLFSAVYSELKRIAFRQLSLEHSDHTFSKTALVHEVFINLADKDRIDWKNRSHFYGIAAICMKQLLIDHARKRMAIKRGGDLTRHTYIDELIPAEKEAKEIISLDKALEELRKLDQRMADIVDYRFFGGLTIKETAEVMGISKNTVNREWAKAKGLLYKKLK